MSYAGAALGVLGSLRIFAGAAAQFKAARSLQLQTQQEAGIILGNADAAAKTSLLNAWRSEFDASRVFALGELAARDAQRQGKTQLSTIRATAAAVGVEETGTVADVLAQQGYETGREVANIAFQASRSASNFSLQAADLRQNSVNIRVRGRDESERLLREGRAQMQFMRAQAYTSISKGFLALGNAASSGIGAGAGG